MRDDILAREWDEQDFDQGVSNAARDEHNALARAYLADNAKCCGNCGHWESNHPDSFDALDSGECQRYGITTINLMRCPFHSLHDETNPKI